MGSTGHCWAGAAAGGGGVDHGEHPLDALRREIYEETGLHAEPGRIVDIYSTHFTGAPTLRDASPIITT